MIVFNSYGDEFEKEKSGKKCNIVRKIERYEPKFEELEKMNLRIAEGHKKQHIDIRNPENHDSFTRVITDITYFDGYVIISWRHE